METRNMIHLLLIVCFSSHLLYTAESTCVPRNFTYLKPSSPPSAARVTKPKSPLTSPISQSPSPVPVTPKSPPTPPTSQSPSPALVTPKSTPTPPISQSPSPVQVTPRNAPIATANPLDGAEESPVPDEKLNPLPSTTPETPKFGLQLPKLPLDSLPVPGVQNPALKKVCDSTDYPLLCLSSVVPFLVPGKFDPVSIFQSEVKACVSHTNILMEKSKKIAADPATPPDTAKALTYCLENYDTLLSDLDKTIQALPGRDKGTMNTMLSAALTDLTTCQDTFKEVTTAPSPLADLENMGNQLISNGLALLDLMIPS
ncbi:hypothetical protein IFM89_004921 [Coptis chinensis]|uniref:Pectinesterase inhibitor domain-containing protein n=1 Tax=Coptis chinensis TaxID=261450 RepID=A0A835HR06_9MAGN|nr:hypothetical protein IFM89_004921 [Coptis chinensis]